MAERVPKRRRVAKAKRTTSSASEEQKTSPPLSPTNHTTDKDKWQGWAEIESDPAFFNVMLGELGVKGVAVREIFSLDSEMLAFLPRPVYGVIFLFRWKEDEEFSDTRFKAGSKIWFANQTVSNACASYALVNIVNNIPGLELGPQLEHFREFTEDFTPALRGDALSNFEFVKDIHNSFTRKMDKLNGDLHMRDQVQSAKQKSRKRNADDDDSESAYHFIAFMPIDGVLWKMDGLEWQPRSLGKVRSDDWVDHVKDDIESRMSRYENDEIDFAILGLVKDPLTTRVAELAANIKGLQQVRAQLTALGVAPAPPEGDTGALEGPDMCYGISTEDIALAEASPMLQKIFKTGSRADLERAEAKLVDAQTALRCAAKEEQDTRNEDHSKSNRRRHDYGDAIHYWLKCLVDKGAVRQLVHGGDH